jgi:hypothetical protein
VARIGRKAAKFVAGIILLLSSRRTAHPLPNDPDYPFLERLARENLGNRLWQWARGQLEKYKADKPFIP